MIVFLLIIVGVFLIVFSPELYAGSKKLARKVKPKQLTSKPTVSLSKVARQLLTEYMKLPLESRPWDDITPMLRGLDAATAHDTQGRMDHYDENAYMRNFYTRRGDSGFGPYELYPVHFRWEPSKQQSCGRGSCEFHAYKNLHDELVKLKEELRLKERALAKQVNAHHIDAAKELEAALRGERQLQNEVRKELE